MSTQEHAAARDILFAHAVSTGLRSGSLEHSHQGGARAGAADAAAARRADALRRYTRWRADLRGTPALAAAVAVLVEERTLRELDREGRWRNGTAMTHLEKALRHYAALAGNTPRGARGWRYRRQ